MNAPEIPEGLNWLNSPPLLLKNLKGKVVLIDFWTYSCINCQRTLPFLQDWWKKYKDSGLVIIGVHTPEFEFEKDPKNVRAALDKYQVDWPVVQDNDYLIWQAYANHYWPAKYLVDHQGKIIYSHFGEGNYQETEKRIQEALKQAGFTVDDGLVKETSAESSHFNQTPETYLGLERGEVKLVTEEPDEFEPDKVYAVGSWKQEDQYLEHPVKTEDFSDGVAISYRAKTVYLVMESASGEPIDVYLTLDGVDLSKTNAGSDVALDSDGHSYVKVQFSTLYNLVASEGFGAHTLRISTLKKGLRLFAFTFGS